VDNAESGMIVSIIPTMPQKLLDKLVQNLSIAVGHHFFETDSRNQDGFESLHMVIYNRYSVQASFSRIY
jgi:hypothetical protein